MIKKVKNFSIVAYICFIILFGLQPVICLSQDSLSLTSEFICPQKDLSDMVREWRNKPLKEKTTGEDMLLLLPIIGSNPATGFMVGAGGQYAFTVPKSSQYSLILGSLQFTTKKQFLLMVKNNIYTKNDRFFLTGDWRFQIFSQSTYGLGTNSPEGGILDYQYSLGGIEFDTEELTQPMNFNFIRFHQSVGYKIAEQTYLGLGVRFDSYFKIEDHKLKLTPGDTLLTSHYAYNKVNGFNPEQYSVAALNANFVIDTRDNMIQAYKGYYLSLNYRGGYTFLGNEKNSNLLQVEWRSFHGLSKKDPSHLLAFWVLGDFVEKESLPYMVLPAAAYDQRGRSARGYTQGRFRGNNYLYTEAEYRFPISPCGGILGGVIFANATTTNNPYQDLNLFESIKPAAGFGFRIKADKMTRTNLAVDFGFGHQSFGFYLAASETF